MSSPAWLQGLPSDWERVQLWTQCTRFSLYGANIASSDYVRSGVRFLRTTDISDRGDLLNDDPVYVPSEVVDGYRLRDGDLLLSRSGTLGRSFVYNAAHHGPCSYAGYLVRYQPGASLNSRYLFYFTKSKAFSAWLRVNAIESTIGNISGQKFASMLIPLPPPAIQEAIASFLDHETSRINTLIEKKRRLLDLLGEKRTALITRAVTRGLDPDVPMKDAGVEWIGEIPEHWEVVELRRALRLVTSGSRGWAEYYADEGALFIRIGNLSKDSPDLDLSDSQLVDVPPGPEAERSRVRAGDLLVSITALIGAVAVVPPDLDAYVNQHVALCRFKDTELNSRFAAYFLLSGPGQAIARLPVYGGTKEGLALDDVKEFRTPLPPRAEQDAIVRYLDERLRLLEEVGRKANVAISLLQEYRTSLISAAVSGRIDVTEATLAPV